MELIRILDPDSIWENELKLKPERLLLISTTPFVKIANPHL